MKKCKQLFTVIIVLTIINLMGSCKENKNDVPAGKQFPDHVITDAVLPPGVPVIETERDNFQTNGGTAPLGDYNAESNNGNTPKGLSREDYLKKKYKNLLVFHADDTMMVNQSRLATLILANDRSIVSLSTEVLEESDAKSNNYQVDTSMDFGNKMKARLISFGGSTADKGFEIEALGEDEQSFRNGRNKIIWQWKVTPLRAGQQSLKLSVQIIYQDGEAASLAAKNIDVVIFAKPESTWKQIGSFLEGHQWLFSVLLIPILVAWFTTRIKNKAPVSTNENRAGTDDKIRTQGGKKRRR